MPSPAKRRKGTGKKVTLHVAEAHNLKAITAGIPPGTFTCVTRVSGSGKSSFTTATLYAADPGNTVSVFDWAVPVSADRFDQPIVFTAPTPADGMPLRYGIGLQNSAQRVFWNIQTDVTTVELPELPTAYDTEVSFPFPGSSGHLFIQSFTRLDMDEEPAMLRDFYTSTSERYPITF